MQPPASISPQKRRATDTPYQVSIFGTLIYAVLLYIFISFLTIILWLPLFETGILSLEVLEQPIVKWHQLVDNFAHAYMLITTVIVTAVVIHLFGQTDKTAYLAQNLSFKHLQTHVLWSILVILFIVGVGSFLLNAFDYINFSYNPVSNVSWGYSIIVMLAIALKEELFFRGFIQQRLLKATNQYAGLFISSFLFTAVYFHNSNLAYISVINLFLVGCLLGLYYMHTQNLWFPITCHFLWDLIQGPVLGFNVNGVPLDSWVTVTAHGNQLLNGGEFGFEGSIICTILTVIAIFLTHLRFNSLRRDKRCTLNLGKELS